jgi:hypothetical protein
MGIRFFPNVRPGLGSGLAIGARSGIGRQLGFGVRLRITFRLTSDIRTGFNAWLTGTRGGRRVAG